MRLFLAGWSAVVLVSAPGCAGDDKSPPPRAELRAVTFGADEAANTKKLAELTADGWEYVGPVGPNGVAFRRGGNGLAGDAAKLQGVWVNVYTEQDGVRETPDSRHVFVGNRYFRIDGDKVREDGTFTVGAAGAVKTIDYKCLSGDYEGLTWHAVYELDGDTFRHFGPWGTENWKNRPARLAEKTDATTFLRAMKREPRR